MRRRAIDLYLGAALGMLPHINTLAPRTRKSDKPRDPDVSRELIAKAEAKRSRKAARRAALAGKEDK